MPKPLDDYVEVSERIEKFYDRYPEGSLRCKEVRPVQVGDQSYVLYIAQAFRTPDDPAPAEGAAWEPVPGKTNFTRDSEVMNCETSAWGRAIAALGFEVKKGVASREEVQQRTEDGASGGSSAQGDAGDPPGANGALSTADVLKARLDLGVDPDTFSMVCAAVGATSVQQADQDQRAAIVKQLQEIAA